MATVNKNFKIKQGLIVEGATATVNGNQVLTETGGDQYILDLIGGQTLITSVKSDDFTVNGGELTIAEGSDLARSGDITTAIDALDTDDIEEGATNLYFTDARAKDVVENSRGLGLAWNGDTEKLDVNTIPAGGSTADSGLVVYPGTGQFAVSFVSIDRNTVDGWYDASGSAATAESNANSYTDGRETAITAAYESYADTAEADAKSYADSLIDDESTTTTNNWSAYKTSAEIGLAQAAAEQHADVAIAALVDSAPETLDTLNELAAALQDNPDIISDLQTIAAGKQDTLTAGDNIDITGSTISVTGLDTSDVAEGVSNLYFTDGRAVNAVTGLDNPSYYALAGKDDKAGVYKPDVASTLTSLSGSGLSQSPAQDGAIQIDRSVVDGWYDSNGAAATAEANAIAHADALTTDDVEEGVGSLYYTDGRATTAAINLLTSPTTSLTNIGIVANLAGGLNITAENGVADSDTDDLTEGTTNLYFTDARAVSALEAVVPNFTAVELNSVAKQVAATLSASTAGIHTAFTWDPSVYGSAEFLVKVSTGSHSEISKVLITKDGAVFPNTPNLAITEYGIVGTNGSLATVSAEALTATTADLIVTTVNNDSTVTVVGTLLA
jgi:hypothetical protein